MKGMYVVKDGKRLRCGYTTGSCSAAAAKACVMMLESGKAVDSVSIGTPLGITLDLKIMDPHIDDGYASCCVVKDGGDDPDVTDGIKIYARVSKRDDSDIVIDGGEGIGRITRKGPFGNIGDAAINPVPRAMIKNEIRKVSKCGFNVLIYAPGGAEIGKKTFNENIGIEGGISIIGTSGIVEPMSDKALLNTIYIEADAIYDEGYREIILFPGNYGEKMVDEIGLSGKKVKISNFIGDSISYCYNKGFRKITLVGHIGKLSKLSIGAFNTHSRVCDVRMEAFIYYLALAKAPYEILEMVKSCVTTEEALDVVFGNGFGFIVHDMRKGCVDRIRRYIKDDAFDIDIYMYSMKYGVLE
jgi:cobalt-precorrin-5B (C1)-methyltransferase